MQLALRLWQSPHVVELSTTSMYALDMSKMPALYIGHGAPMMLDDPLWTSQLRDIAGKIEKPKAIVMVSAHWESEPITLSNPAANSALVYDFSGFDKKFYEMTYNSPDATQISELVASMMPDTEPVYQSNRGLDHGAWVPLRVMYPDADAPTWSSEFDAWAAQALANGDVDALSNYKELAPGMPYAHPTVEHFTPLFITLGAATAADVAPDTLIDGYFMGLSKRSILVA